MNKYLILTVFMCISFVVCAQKTSYRERPEWLDGWYADSPRSYVEVVSATGRTEAEARREAARWVIERRMGAAGLQVKIQGNDIVLADGSLTVKARIIDEYSERSGTEEWRVSLLVQTAKYPDKAFEEVRVTDCYPFSSRVFLPGMAQLHKGSVTKGCLFIAGEVAFIGGIVAFESLRATKQAKINTTHDLFLRKKYINDTDRMRNLRNGFIAGAAAIYLWNVIDGCVAKGKKHLWIQKNRMCLVPYTTGQTTGMVWTMNF